MSNSKPIKSLTSVSHETPLTLLETYPGALFFLDEAEKIVYANTSTQTMLGVSPETLVGNSFWCNVPQLVSPSLYLAVQKTKQTRAPTEVEYVSPVTQTWLHVQLSPTVRGILVQFHKMEEPLPSREAFFPDQYHVTDILESMYVGIGFLTTEGILLDINDVPLADAQIQREEVIGKPFAETPWWSSSPTSQHQLRAAIARASRGETVRFETLVHPREGMELYLEAVIIPHKDRHHSVEYLVYVGTDITERKRAEAAIHALIDALPQLVWTGRPDGYVDSYNQRWCDYTGIATEQAQGNGWLQCIHPDDQQHILALWQDAVQNGRPYEAEQRMRQSTTGAYRWFLVRATPFKDTQGTIFKWFGTCTDIHDKKRAEQQLKESRESLRVLAETVPQFVWMVRPDGAYEYRNQRLYDYIGFELEQTPSDWQRSCQFIHPEDRDRTRELWQHALETGAMFEHEERLINAQTGVYRWFLTRALPVRDEAGQIVKWVGTSTDIEEQKRTEAALRASQERVNALMNSSIIGIFVSEDSQIVDVNDTFLRMTGYTRKDLREGGINWMQITPPEYLARTVEAYQELYTRQSMTPYEKEYICKDGSHLPVLVGAILLEHHPNQSIGFVLDNSARKELEQRKDAFISMASHELKTPLTALKMQTQLARRRLERQSLQEAATALEMVEKPVKQLERLVEELLDVSKIQAGKLEYRQEMVDLGVLLREVVETMQQTHSSHTIVVRGTLHSSLMGDRDRLGQVFTNLLSNAIKYSPGAETIEMDLRASEDAVTIRVQDHGLGIPREQCDKIFDRFYRVVGPRQRAIPGLGMGLYIVAEIVKSHGGIITVESDVGKGSTFTVTFPKREDA
ncbi:PAS domain-containing sensor histidine kinase [Ktedonospora formicarum]|uniref:histidine kinase n=1 Tax=Ktedonospora formicarum TaxID=2778364 RepID=A0A8J3MNF9_9CHLR|nr:PAS domain-containing sensor histidine kinase [Ktedonospora formicarum]GHO41875.1 hypothetical protein KSX_00380 [Ktedonospora formicarum]